MGTAQDQFTVNIVDTGIFWGLGKPPGGGFDTLRTSVRQANATLYLPQAIYEELGGNPDASSYPSGSDYVDPGIEEGWITVADPIDDHPVVQEVIRDAEHVLRKKDDHPKTARVKEDTTIIGLAAQKFVRNESLYVIIHTNDRAVAEAAIIALNEKGFADTEANFVPPQEAKSRLSTPERFTASKH